MKRPVKLGVWALGLVGVLVFLTYALLLFNSFRNRQKAEALLQDIKSLEVGVSTTEDVLRVVEQYQGKRRPQGQNTEPTPILYSFETKFPFPPDSALERFLFPFQDHFVWLGRYLDAAGIHAWRIRGSLGLSEDRLYYVSYEIAMERWNRDSPHSPSGYFPSMAREYPYWVGYFSDKRPDESLMALLTPESTAEQRRRAFDFDLTCLTSFNGCRSRCELMPSAWEDMLARLRSEGYTFDNDYARIIDPSNDANCPPDP